MLNFFLQNNLRNRFLVSNLYEIVRVSIHFVKKLKIISISVNYAN